MRCERPGKFHKTPHTLKLKFVVAILAIVLGSSVAITLGAMQSASRKKGLSSNASRDEMDGMRRDLDALGEEVRGMQEALADVTLMLADSDDRRLPSGDDRD